jgi:antibiotic biosynthesis monooxygenase (ABM) superfamily enzyme
MLSLPSRLRFTACLMVGAYPVVTLVLAALAPLTATWSLPLRTALAVPVIVALMVFAVIPTVHRLAGRWIAKGT